MTTTVALRGNTYAYLRGGGHLWVYLNWARGLQRSGCEVLWLEVVPGADDVTARNLRHLRTLLTDYGLGDSLVVATFSGAPLRGSGLPEEGVLDGVDLLLDLAYDTPEHLVRKCRRSALVDIDPGLTQCWWADGLVSPVDHDFYFTTGEGVGGRHSRVPDCGVEWVHVTPVVDTESWATSPLADDGAPFTTITHWEGDEWFCHGGASFDNSKRAGFAPYLELPARTAAPLELALPLESVYDGENLLAAGWRLRDSWEVARTPTAYQSYIRSSRGEFSCAKPSTVHLRNAWVSDRTLCYLSSGRPVIVQDTGPSSYLPEGEGFLRFRSPTEAARRLEAVITDYDRHSARARQLATEVFDAKKVLSSVLERTLS
ncbi:glycosyltransferase [Blastococcus deserti]|uniref:Glycosyltransferase n=1 Tax=Blastococcus deserti TaxID=2259033 RepID=A0ABW4XDU3_9ACTN